MAKEIAVGKRAKISEAQQYMLLSVFVASIFLGAAISLVINFVKQISFNSNVIATAERSIASYSNIIKSVGVCKKPDGDVYSDDELAKCDPDGIELSEISGTLRANILEGMASNKALNSVPKEDSNSGCVNPSDGKNYTYDELNKIYQQATGASELRAASQLIKSCSALRVIPDALPAFENEEALMASIDMLYRVSGWEPESLHATQSSEASDLASDLNTISVNIAIEADSGITNTVLRNLERSIRQLDFERATITWKGTNELNLSARATAYFMDKASLNEVTTTLKAEGKK